MSGLGAPLVGSALLAGRGTGRAYAAAGAPESDEKVPAALL